VTCRIANKLIFIFTTLILFTSLNANAEDEGITTSAGVEIYSKYIWRGYKLNNDSIVIQPSLAFDYKGFGINGWANVDTDSEAGHAWNETDITLSYDTSAGPVNLGAGYIYYDIKDSDNTSELYASVSYDSFLTPTLIIYRDIGVIPGYYFNLGLSHSIDLTNDITLDLAAGAGYYISCNDSIVEAGTEKKFKGLQDGIISAGLSIPISDKATLSPVVSYSFAMTDKAKALLGTSGNLFGGLTLSVRF
jgi:uncharacterized protein (TIGR02001 family)